MSCTGNGLFSLVYLKWFQSSNRRSNNEHDTFVPCARTSSPTSTSVLEPHKILLTSSLMEPISFGLGVIAEARTLVASIKTRINNYCNGPQTFQTLSGNVDRLARHIEQVEKLLRKFPGAVPEEVAAIFSETFSAVRVTLESSIQSMEQFYSKAFGESSTRVMNKLRSKAYRTSRANSLDSSMNAVDKQIKEASNQLLQLALALGNHLKMQELHDTLAPKIESLEVGITSSEVYRPWVSAPALSATVNLDFDSKDDEGPAAPEGILKQTLMSSDSSSSVTAAAGVMKSAYGIVGMAGVGKTVALQGLAHDMDVRNRFPDGVFFMTLGQDATVQTVLRELVRIMVITGAKAIVATVKNSTSIREAVDYAVPWLKGRTCLFLADDIWPTKNCKVGFLTDLRQLLRESPESRMAISTRSTTIAQSAGSVVKFGARDPLGSISVKIFMAHAASGMDRDARVCQNGKLKESVVEILSICSGLPIALAVTGCAVALLTGAYGGFDRACDTYATRLEKKRRGLGDEYTSDGKCLNAGILLSLEFLEAEYLKWKTRSNLHVEHSISDLYTSLCVLENQAWVPVSVLGRLWKIEEDDAMDIVNLFCGMSLASLHMRRSSSEFPEVPGIILHDLQLEFCRREAIKTKMTSPWHAQLLNGYLEASNAPMFDEKVAQIITNLAPRPWWSNAVAEDGYIHANLARHLSCSDQGMELAALLLNARWTHVRTRIGGILALETDFSQVQRIFMDTAISKANEHRVGDVQRCFNQIFKAVRLAWGHKLEGERTFHFQLLGRLARSRTSSTAVDAYCRSASSITPKPYLMPVSSFFPDLNSAQIMEIVIGGECSCVACSPCGRYFAAGAGNDVVIADSNSGEILSLMEGHTEKVSSVYFAGGSTRLVSGSEGTVMIWNWESSNSPVQVSEAPTNTSTYVAVSGNGERIVSSHDRILRIWDVTVGGQVEDLLQESFVNCIAICSSDGKIAIGCIDGTLTVLDGATKDVIFKEADDQSSSFGDEEEDVTEFTAACVAFSPNGLYMVAGSYEGDIHLWNTSTWEKTIFLIGEYGCRKNGLAFSPDSQQIAWTSSSGTIRLSDVENETCIRTSPEISSTMESLSFSSDGEKMISGSSEGTVHVWDVRLFKASKDDTNGHTREVNAVAISQNGLRVASASGDGTVRLWDTQTGSQIGVPLTGHTGEVKAVSFSRDGRRLVSLSRDCCLKMWDTENFAQIWNSLRAHGDYPACSVSLVSDGLEIVSSYFDVFTLETKNQVWNAETGEEVEQIGDVLHGHEAAVHSVSDSADGCHIVSRDECYQSIIRHRETNAIIWKSKRVESESESFSENEISDTEAEEIIRSCGDQTPNIWPGSFPAYSAEVYYKNGCVHSNLLPEEQLISIPGRCWATHPEEKVFAAGMESGDVVICKLVTE